MFADAEGHPTDRQTWLSRELIERFILVGITASDRTKANYRFKLLLLREAIIGNDCRTGKPIKLSASTLSKPYTHSEIGALWSWAAGQPTEELRQAARSSSAWAWDVGWTRQRSSPCSLTTFDASALAATTAWGKAP